MLELLHPVPSLLTTLAAVACALIFGIPFGDGRLWLIAVIMLLVQVSISALNDWADAELDARSARPRPIPLKLMSRGTAAWVAALTAGAAVLVSGLSGFGWAALLLVLLGLIAGWGYDLSLKRTPLSFLPFAVAFPLLPVWVGVVAHRAPGSLLAIVIGGVPLAIGIHLADAIPDRETDRASGIRTLAVFLAKPAAEIAAAVLVGAGSAVAITLMLRRFGNGLSGVAMIALAALYLTFALATPAIPESRRLLLGKWILIADALAAGILLIAVA